MSGWAPAEKLEEVRTAPFDSQMPREDTRVVKGPGWLQLITPSSRGATFNEIIESQMTEAEADARIDATMAEYAAAGVPFKWIVSPTSKPADLADRLERRGLASWWARGMALEIEPGGAPVELPKDVTVEPLTDSNLPEVAATTATGWSTDLDETRRDLEAAMRLPERRHFFHLARHRENPCGVGGYVRKSRSAYLISAVVLKEFRNLGIYRALVGTRVSELAASGIELATTHARELTSAPILERLGFETMYRYRIFSNR